MKKFLTILVVIILAGVGISMFTGADKSKESTERGATEERQKAQNDEVSTADETERDSASADTESDEGVVSVQYTENGFNPEIAEVAVGDTVQFISDGTGMWVAVNQHPTHAQYDQTTLTEHCPDPENKTFDQCERGDSYEFTFNKRGTYAYHNHVRASDTGVIEVVQE